MTDTQGLVKCQQPAAKLATLRFESSILCRKRVKQDSESLKFPTVLDCQATYFYILVVYFNVTRILDTRIIFATSNIPEVIYLLVFNLNVVLLKINSTVNSHLVDTLL